MLIIVMDTAFLISLYALAALLAIRGETTNALLTIIAIGVYRLKQSR